VCILHKDDDMKYISLWIRVTLQTTQVALASRLGVTLFTVGKLLRFVFFMVFLSLITSKTKTLGGYTIWEVILFFLTFNLIDIIAQFLWREVYRFRSYIVSGSFDMVLTKPISPLLRILFGGSDVLDLLTLVPLLLFMGYVSTQINEITVLNIFLYILLVINGLVIAMSFHIFVLALGVVTTEVDNAIWIFREITQLGRFPLNIYPKAVTFLFTFLLPIAAMISIPTQALLGILTVRGVIICICLSGIFLSLSLLSWREALKRYASASS